MHDDGADHRGDASVEPPRLLAASVDPQHGRDRDGQWSRMGETSEGRQASPGPGALGRNESPRKIGRSRTDTMVFSEAVSVAEELAKADIPDMDLDNSPIMVKKARRIRPADDIAHGESSEVGRPEPEFESVQLQDASSIALSHPWRGEESHETSAPVIQLSASSSSPESPSESAVAAALSEFISDAPSHASIPAAPEPEEQSEVHPHEEDSSQTTIEQTTSEVTIEEPSRLSDAAPRDDSPQVEKPEESETDVPADEKDLSTPVHEEEAPPTQAVEGSEKETEEKAPEVTQAEAEDRPGEEVDTPASEADVPAEDESQDITTSHSDAPVASDEHEDIEVAQTASADTAHETSIETTVSSSDSVTEEDAVPESEST